MEPWGSTGRSAPSHDRLRDERLARAKQGARGVRDRGAALLRHVQHPLPDRDAHRHLGLGQAQPFLPAAAGRRADHVGLRLGRTPPPALQPMAGRGALARRHLHDAWCDVARLGRAEDVADKIRVELEPRGLLDQPVGVDAVEPPVLFALQREGIDLSRSGWPAMGNENGMGCPIITFRSEEEAVECVGFRI